MFIFIELGLIIEYQNTVTSSILLWFRQFKDGLVLYYVLGVVNYHRIGRSMEEIAQKAL